METTDFDQIWKDIAADTNIDITRRVRTMRNFWSKKCGIGATGLRHRTFSIMHAYDEIIDFIAGGITSESVARFEPSQLIKDDVADPIQKEKTTGLTPEEASELDDYATIEHIIKLAKVRG